ncbi:MAG: AraC family transcriptional regulator [Breznakibacter sp.]
MLHNQAYKKQKLDPADSKQQIFDVRIHLLCCRYWKLKEWECANLASPFWRLYHNTLPGASISFQEKWIDLTSATLVVIPPHTSFAASLCHQLPIIDHESIVGKKIEMEEPLSDIKKGGMVDHLFIHFNLGMMFDMIEPQILAIECTKYQETLLNAIKRDISANHAEIEPTTAISINLLIMGILTQIPSHQWHKNVVDRRVADAISYLREHELVKISNEELAFKANMATNAFARLFKESTGMTIQQYLMKIRIEKACLLMHHTSLSIDDIALKCGFFDRHHFSKAFKQALNITPAYYMKKLTMSPGSFLP